MHDSQAPTFRTARPEEIQHAAEVCPPAPALPGEGPARCFVAVEERPTPQIVGAIFWREVPPEGDWPLGVTFEWAMLDDLADSPVETDFLIALVTEIQLAAPAARWLAPSTSLPEGHPLTARLLQAAFQQGHSQTHHFASLTDIAAWLEKFPDPQTPMAVLSPGEIHFVPLKAKFCGKSRALRESHLVHGLQKSAGATDSVFDYRCSVVLVEGQDIAAACLANVREGHLNLTALHLPTGPIQLLPTILRQVIARAEMFAPPISVGFNLQPGEPPDGLPALLEIPAFQRVGTSRTFRRELHFPG